MKENFDGDSYYRTSLQTKKKIYDWLFYSVFKKMLMTIFWTELLLW